MDIDKLRDDFDGEIAKLADQIGHEFEFIHKTMGDDGFHKEILEQTIRRLAMMVESDAPECMIEWGCQILAEQALARWPDLLKKDLPTRCQDATKAIREKYSI